MLLAFLYKKKSFSVILSCIFLYGLCMPLQSMNESQIPDSLLERLLAGASEFPPVCAIIGGILGQVII